MKLTMLRATLGDMVLRVDSVEAPTIQLAFQNDLSPNSVTSSRVEELHIDDCLDATVDAAIDAYNHKRTGSAILTSQSGRGAIRERVKDYIRNQMLVIFPHEIWQAYTEQGCNDRPHYVLKDGNILMNEDTFEIYLAHDKSEPCTMLMMDTAGRYYTSRNTAKTRDVMESMEQ